jgi:hypothetical protein
MQFSASVYVTKISSNHHYTFWYIIYIPFIGNSNEFWQVFNYHKMSKQTNPVHPMNLTKKPKMVAAAAYFCQ